jgi:hypothetical protein
MIKGFKGFEGFKGFKGFYWFLLVFRVLRVQIVLTVKWLFWTQKLILWMRLNRITSGQTKTDLVNQVMLLGRSK